MKIEEVLIIKEQGCYYGINTDEVEQILRVQDLTPMAMTPKAIRGLCSIEGTIVSTLDFSILLDGRKKEVDTEVFKARQVTIHTKVHTFSLLVSEVINSVEVDQELVEYVEDQDDVIVALLKHEEEIIQIVSVEKLIKDIKLPSYVTKDVRDVSKDVEQETKSYVQRFLFFMMGKEQYALEVDSIREIISVPESFTAIAESNKEILGMMSLRDDLLVVADLREYYNFNSVIEEKNRIIVSQSKGRHIGLVVDEIVDIQDVELSHIEGMPENFKDKKINGVLHLDEQLISVVNTDVVRTLVKEQSHLIGEKNQENEVETEVLAEDHIEVVIFKMAGEEYAFDIDNVSEIIDMTEITPIADSIEHIKGVINIRGQVISIASLYTILKLEENEELDQQIIITDVNGTRVGFVVDKVNDVRGISTDEINKEDEKGRIFSNILQLEEGKRLVMMFDSTILLESLNLDEKDVA